MEKHIIQGVSGVPGGYHFGTNADTSSGFFEKNLEERQRRMGNLFSLVGQINIRIVPTGVQELCDHFESLLLKETKLHGLICNINERLKTLELELVEQKKIKLKRDIWDYENGQAFIWRSNQKPREFSIRAYRFLRGMFFAINEINQTPEILPNVTLGFHIFDTCFTETRAIEVGMWLSSRQANSIPNYHCVSHSVIPAIIGDGPSACSLPVARVLGLYKFPQISHGSTLPSVQDKTQVPSFLAIVPNTKYQSIGIARILIHFGWKWIGIVASDNDYGNEGSLDLKQEFIKAGGCVAFLDIIPNHNSMEWTKKIAENIKMSTVTVVVLFSTTEKISPLIEELFLLNVTGKIWISTISWPSGEDFYSTKVQEIANGTLAFIYHRGQINGMKDFLHSINPLSSPNDIFITSLWEKAFNCQWRDSRPIPVTEQIQIVENKSLCTGKEMLSSLDNTVYDVINFRYTYNVYNSAYAVAHALHSLYSCIPLRGPFINVSCANIKEIQPWQLFHYVKNVHFKNRAGDEIFFNEDGEGRARYDIVNWQVLPNGTVRNPNVGIYESRTPGHHEVSIDESAILWNTAHSEVPKSVCSESCPTGHRKAARRGEPVCCYDCAPCSKGEISNQTDSMECNMCPEMYWSDEKHEKCIHKTIEFLSYEEALGIILCTVSMFICLLSGFVLCVFIRYRDTPIVKANNRELSYLILVSLMLCSLCSLIFIGHPEKTTCLLRQTAFGLIFSFSVSCILSKTITVVIAFNAKNPNSRLRNWVGQRISNSVVIFGSFIQFLICMSWLVCSPPFPKHNSEAEGGKIIIECNEGSPTAFWYMFGYMGVLSTVSFIVAFMARSLPDSFNEAKFIAFSMLVFVSVWLSFIPAYLSTKGKYTVAVEIFAILSSTSGILSCIFFPKCYMILVRPELNTREQLMGKRNKKN
ncbi:extracellular calcium-sensing receptor-like [Protopterus annectens]|uniref:extracellular calcium-sensing receptor-like n=1 Tax=Protopterus annectens TaxID=7888 RepID=UPI001CF979C1|nr:extracellular calcium-sensing receptor-like [Protopterus annectens]